MIKNVKKPKISLTNRPPPTAFICHFQPPPDLDLAGGLAVTQCQLEREALLEVCGAGRFCSVRRLRPSLVGMCEGDVEDLQAWVAQSNTTTPAAAAGVKS